MTRDDVKRLFDVVAETGQMRPLEVHAVLDILEAAWKERDEARLDIAYLAARADGSGRSFGPDRDFGISSDALVRLAYGGRQPNAGEVPHEREDYSACVRAVERLPEHRRTALVLGALRRVEIEWATAEQKRDEVAKGGNDDT